MPFRKTDRFKSKLIQHVESNSKASVFQRFNSFHYLLPYQSHHNTRLISRNTSVPPDKQTEPVNCNEGKQLSVLKRNDLSFQSGRRWALQYASHFAENKLNNGLANSTNDALVTE